jgi:hydrogenase maturation protein HypF
MADNDLEGDVLGVAWDGTGYGIDGTIWGGEFLELSRRGFRRAACLRPFRLPGGEQAVREPRRSALGLLDAIALHWREVRDLKVFQSFTARECSVLWQALAQHVNAPVTTSAGRLFDAAAAIVGVCERATFEGQAAMALEAIAEPSTRGSYPFLLPSTAGAPAPVVVDWEPSVRALIEDLRTGVPRSIASARFHNTLAEMIVAVAEIIGEPRVVLSGGCFQNRYLLEGAVSRLRHAGFKPYWHQRLPPNDGGLAVGQLVWMAQQREQALRSPGRAEGSTSRNEVRPCA